MRRLHGSGAAVRAVGVFRVRHGSNRLARAIARLARLPAAGEAVDVRLQVTAREEGEEWRRSWEKAIGDMHQIHVSVDVTFPLLGRLIAYDGMLTQIEAQR
jgi:Domain of unknown function (DUF4166)